MPETQPEPAAAPAADAADAAEILREITRIAYLITRARRHDRVRTVAAVPLDRAAVMVLGQLAEAGPVRPGELADRLGVEAPHVTRQVQRLQQAGYADRVPDPDDRRAQLIQLTPAGRAAVGPHPRGGHRRHAGRPGALAPAGTPPARHAAAPHGR